MNIGQHGRLRLAMSACVLVTAIVAITLLAWQPPKSRAVAQFSSASQTVERAQAAEQAASLLTTGPGPARPELSGRSGVEPSVDSLEDLQAFARSWSGSTKPQRADPRPAVTKRTTMPPASMLPSRKTAELRPRIPDKIEGTGPLSSDDDALSSMTLEANLITIDATHAPLVLRDVRSSQTPPQVRLEPSHGSSGSDSAWFEPGDSPTPGWMLVHIDLDAATLMSVHGDLVRLHVDPAPANETTAKSRTAN